MMRNVAIHSPSSDVELFSDEILRDPYRCYSKLRELGSAVYLSRYGVWALTRHDSVRSALHEWQTCSSTAGIALNAVTNDATGLSPLAADPPAHRIPRRILAENLSPMAVQEQEAAVVERAKQVCAAACERGSFDAVCDFAQPFVHSTVMAHVGVQITESIVLESWADAAFDVMGPENERTRSARAYLAELCIHLLAITAPHNLEPDGAGYAIYRAAQRGELTLDGAAQILAVYLIASLSSTIAATSSALWLFARHPEQWDLLHAEPGLIPNAVNEVLRLESPIQSFSRALRVSYEVDDLTLPAGDRIVLLFGSANRDEAFWQDADTFDITRSNVDDHLTFGHGLHGCAGQMFARMVLGAVLEGFVDRVARWTPGDARWKSNNLLRALSSFPVAVNGCAPRKLVAPIVRQSLPVEAMKWRLTGTISTARPRLSVPLPADATFLGTVNIAAGTMEGSLDIPTIRTGLTAFGIAAGATTRIAPVGSFHGQIDAGADGRIKMSAVSRSDLEICALHLGRLTVKLKCRTVRPIEMRLQSEGIMSLTFRPAFAGDMVIPRLRGSGPIGWLLSKLIAGGGHSFDTRLELLPTSKESVVVTPQQEEDK
jgi:cytochrome P450